MAGKRRPSKKCVMKQSILIIDDSPPLHKLVRAILGDEPVTIHSAYCAEEGLTMAAQVKPALILLDVDMPKIDGFEVCRRLKTDPATQYIAIAFLTAKTTLSQKVAGLNFGASDYIAKPFKPEELLARVRSTLRNKTQLDEAAIADELTLLWNRKYLDLHLPTYLSIARRNNRPLSCIAGEIDCLKKTSKANEESVGNEIIRSVAKIFSGQVQAHDIVCHVGDGHFVALLPGTNVADATLLAEKLRAHMEQQLKNRDGIEIGVTGSFGVAEMRAQYDSALLECAEAALCAAKRSGRNSISVSRPRTAESCGVA
jgi:two-component system, cell cycle response regulator